MARRKKRRKNPDGPGMKNLLFALAAGVGLYLIVRELQKRGMLGNGDYGQKPVAKPKPAPVYKPDVVRTMQSVKTYMPSAVTPSGRSIAPVADLYGALKLVDMHEQRKPQATAQITAATNKMNEVLAQHRAKLTAAKSQDAKNQIMKVIEQDKATGEANVAAAKRAFEASDYQKKLNDLYANARNAAKSAVDNEKTLRAEYGDENAKAAVKRLREALVESGDEEYATSEGSVERPQ
jgi:predicted DNA-binding protein (UPF0251 family)